MAFLSRMILIICLEMWRLNWSSVEELIGLKHHILLMLGVLLWSRWPIDKHWRETRFKYFRTQDFDPKPHLHPRWLSQVHVSTASAVHNHLGTPFCWLSRGPGKLTRNHIKVCLASVFSFNFLIYFLIYNFF